MVRSGPITGVALLAIYKFLSYGIISASPAHSVSLSLSFFLTRIFISFPAVNVPVHVLIP
jgi:hypothetical protein